MQEESGRVEVKDFAFRTAHRLRLFPSPESTGGNIFDGLTSYRLLTVSNAYGLIFVAWPGQALKVIPTSEIHRLLDDTSRDRDNEVVNYKSASIELGGGASSPIVRLHCNCDGTTLAICYDHPTPIAHIYDVRALSPDCLEHKPITPYCQIQLDVEESSTLADFKWNPTTPDVFSSCCSSGTVTVVSVNMEKINAFTVQGAIKRTPEAAATCLSWSPKGTQLWIGFDNGLVCQYKPQNLQLAKKWPPPSQAVALLLHRLVDICWLSTNQFALVSTGGRPEGDQLVLVHMTLPKESGAAGGGNPVYVNYDDVCYGSAGERRSIPTRYLMQHVQEWAMLLCSSTASTETAVLAWKADIKKWQVWDLEENGRCQLPLTAVRSDETYPIGIDVDRTAEAPVQLKRPDGEIERIIPPAPIMLILSTDGAICPFRMVFKGSDTALCQPAKSIIASVMPKLEAISPKIGDGGYVVVFSTVRGEKASVDISLFKWMKEVKKVVCTDILSMKDVSREMVRLTFDDKLGLYDHLPTSDAQKCLEVMNYDKKEDVVLVTVAVDFNRDLQLKAVQAANMNESTDSDNPPQSIRNQIPQNQSTVPETKLLVSLPPQRIQNDYDEHGVFGGQAHNSQEQ